MHQNSTQFVLKSNVGAGHLSPAEFDTICGFDFQHKFKMPSTLHAGFRAYYPEIGWDSLKVMRKEMRILSELDAKLYDCCKDSCCAFVGPHKDKDRCPYCQSNRYDSSGKSINQYEYIPLIPRLQAMYASKKSAQRRRYRAEGHKAEFGKIKDYIDGDLYKSACRRRVKVGGRTLDHNHFSDPRDVGLLLLSDGFRIFKKGRHSAWASMAINLNLPPDERCHLDETLIICIIPGPQQPKDPDSFHWPLVEELTTAAMGIPTYDALADARFILHIYALLMSADGPGAAKVWLHTKTHSAFTPCRYCTIHGMRPPAEPGKKQLPVMYIPLKQPPGAAYTRGDLDPLNLPLQSHDTFVEQAQRVQAAPTKAQRERLAKEYGINGPSIYFKLSSLLYPICVPGDFMHLLANIMEALVELWTGEFKGLDSGTHDYQFSKTVWDAIGAATKAASTHLPAAFGRRLDNISGDRTYFTAESWLIWTTLIAPALLHNRFKRPQYYTHFVELVKLFTLCLEYEISTARVAEIRSGFAKWVEKFEQ
jgi:hypothetical protein